MEYFEDIVNLHLPVISVLQNGVADYDTSFRVNQFDAESAE